VLIKKQFDNYNTFLFRVYIFSLVLEWVKNQGGLVAMEANSKAKSELLYSVISDSQGFYSCPVAKDCRSRITVPFCLNAGPEADKQFLKEAQELGFLQLKGHRYIM
jgi:phosphoserine aminotransferase